MQQRPAYSALWTK